jgi:hypothetical protein
MGERSVERVDATGGLFGGGTRAAALLLARFAGWYALLGAALWGLGGYIYPVVGRLARDISILSAEVPRVSALVWSESSFHISSPLIGGYIGLTAPWFAVALAVPLAFALALPRGPGPSRWRVLAWVLLGGLAFGGVMLANNSLAALSEILQRQGLAIFSPERVAAHRALRSWTWNLCTLFAPAAACLWIGAPLLPWKAVGAPRTRRRRVPPGVGLAVTALAFLALFAWADRTAEARLGRLDRETLRTSLDPWNPELGAYFLKAGERELSAGRPGLARQNFLLALHYPEYAERANAGLKRASRGAGGGR